MRHLRSFLFPLIGILCAVFASQSMAQSEVVARATLFKQVQYGFPYNIRLFDDTRAGRAALESLELELERRGVLISPDGIFRIDIAVERISASFDEASGSLGFVGTTDKNEFVDTRPGGLELTMNVWSSRQDSLIGGRQKRRRSTSKPFIHINAIVRDNQTRDAIWQGDALAPIYRADEEAAAFDAAVALARVFGKSGVYPEY